MLKLLFSFESTEVTIIKDIIDGLGEGVNVDTMRQIIDEQDISESEKEILVQYAQKKAA
jgi:hypothetical protein